MSKIASRSKKQQKGSSNIRLHALQTLQMLAKAEPKLWKSISSGSVSCWTDAENHQSTGTDSMLVVVEHHAHSCMLNPSCSIQQEQASEAYTNWITTTSVSLPVMLSALCRKRLSLLRIVAAYRQMSAV